MQIIIKNKITAAPVEFNFDELKADLSAALEKYQTPAADFAEAKADRAKLNKFKDALDVKRKEVKAACLAPYSDFEAKVKELTGMVDKPLAIIDARIKDEENAAKAAKKAELQAYFETGATFPDAAAFVGFDAIFDPRWTNASYKLQQAKQDIITRLQVIDGDLKAIADFPEKYRNAGKLEYKNSLSLSTAIAKMRELEAMDKKPAADPIPGPQPEPSPMPEDPEPVYTVAFKVMGTKKNLLKLKDFLENNQLYFEQI